MRQDPTWTLKEHNFVLKKKKKKKKTMNFSMWFSTTQVTFKILLKTAYANQPLCCILINN